MNPFNNITMTHLDTIVFDFGGVLIDWNPEYVFKQLFDDEKESVDF